MTSPPAALGPPRRRYGRVAVAALAVAAIALACGAAQAAPAPAPPGGVPDVTLPDGVVPPPPHAGPRAGAPSSPVLVPAPSGRQVVVGADGHLRLAVACATSPATVSVTVRLGTNVLPLGAHRAVCRAGRARLDLALGASARRQIDRAVAGTVDAVARSAAGAVRTRVALLAHDPARQGGTHREQANLYWGSAQCLGPGAFGGSATISLTAPPFTLPRGHVSGIVWVRTRVVTYSYVTRQWYWSNPTAWRAQALTSVPAWFSEETYNIPSGYQDVALGMIEVYTSIDGYLSYDWNWARLAVATDGAYSLNPYCYFP